MDKSSRDTLYTYIGTYDNEIIKIGLHKYANQHWENLFLFLNP